jgi:hypothetical protein
MEFELVGKTPHEAVYRLTGCNNDCMCLDSYLCFIAGRAFERIKWPLISCQNILISSLPINASISSTSTTSNKSTPTRSMNYTSFKSTMKFSTLAIDTLIAAVAAAPAAQTPTDEGVTAMQPECST